MTLWTRSRILAGTLFMVLVAAATTPLLAQWGQRQRDYDGRLTFVRVRWRNGKDGTGRTVRGNNFWLHEFPTAEKNLMSVLRSITAIDANDEGSLVLTLDDPQLFHYPIAVMWEPGYWVMSDEEAQRLREYFEKGGFLIINDFELDQWKNFELQMRRVWPDAQWIRLDKQHQIFKSFFGIDRPDVPHAAYHHLVGLTPEYWGLFEQNDPRRRLLAIANYNTNLAEYWQAGSAGFFPVESSNNAFKLGINYMMYALTH
jgi:hypothetical protein